MDTTKVMVRILSLQRNQSWEKPPSASDNQNRMRVLLYLILYGFSQVIVSYLYALNVDMQGELFGNSGNTQCVSNDFSDTLIDFSSNGFMDLHGNISKTSRPLLFLRSLWQVKVGIFVHDPARNRRDLPGTVPIDRVVEVLEQSQQGDNEGRVGLTLKGLKNEKEFDDDGKSSLEPNCTPRSWLEIYDCDGWRDEDLEGVFKAYITEESVEIRRVEEKDLVEMRL
ncbi:hypothetical protein Tco_1320732 [Tanacetum coccineum]